MGPGIMNIQVRVLAANARRTLRGVRAEMQAVQAQAAATSAVSPVGQRSFADMTKAGNQMQWVGRQLQYNFTLPLLLAGAAATKFQLDQESAMVHVAKVYGDSTAATEYWAKNTQGWYKGVSSASEQASKVIEEELGALDKAFEALSVRFATQKKDVLEIAGAWAAAGVSGRELAESVENTLIASNIGDFDATAATEALVSIQAQYNMGAGQLTRTLAELNAIENATTVSMKGLIESMAKSGSAAAATGTSARYLAAMTSAITPAAGSAAQAGNALKTILSRINKPTEEGAAAMEQLGVNTDSAAWKALSGAEKLQVLQKGFNKLDDSQQNANASATVGIYQYNRYIQLLKDMGRENGNYAKALEATTDKEKVFKTMNRELNTILESNPKRLQRMGIALQNSLADIVQPLIPYIIYLAQELAQLANWFNNLPPSIQKVGLTLGVLLIVMPLLLRYLGSLRTLFVVTRVAVGGLARWLGILTTATAVQTVVDGKAATVTEVRRRGLIGLFAVMLAAPFGAFARMADAGLGAAATGFRAFAAVSFRSLLWFASGGLKGMVMFFSNLVGVFTAGGAATATAAAATESTLTKVTTAGARARTAAEVSGLGAIQVAEQSSYVSRVTAMQAFNSYRLGLAQAYNSAMFGLEAGASSKRLAIEAATTSASTAMVVRGNATVVASTAASTSARLALISRLKAGVITAVSLMVMGVARAGMAVVAAMFGPWGIAVGLILALLYTFRDQVGQIWNNIVSYFKDRGNLAALWEGMVSRGISAFQALPQGVQSAMVAVVRVVRSAALAVYEWFSYINPFARHSPSLVENVTFGMQNVVKQFSTLGQIKRYTDGAYRELNKFGQATRNITGKAQGVEIRQDRNTLAKGGASKEALASYDKLQGKLRSMRDIYARMGAEIDKLSKRDIVARRKMEDAIFKNTFAQKKLRLEMLGMEKAVGTLDDVRSKLEAIAGEQEVLRGTQTDLRNAGAGSDILGFYDKQLEALDGQRENLQKSADKMQEIDDRMKKLQLEGERLDLEKAMKFDRVDYRLEKMREQYDLIGNTISDMEQGISAAVQAQERLNQAAEANKAARQAKKRTGMKDGAKDKFPNLSGGGADFPDVTGKGLGGRTNWESELKGIDDFYAEQVKKSAGLFAEINPFKKFGSWWEKTWSGTVKPKMQAAKEWMGGLFGGIFEGVTMPKSLTNLSDKITEGFDGGKITEKIRSALGAVRDFLMLFWPDVKRFFTNGWNSLWDGLKGIGKEVAAFGDLWEPLKDIFSGTWKIVKRLAVVLGAVLIPVLKIVASALGHFIGPAIGAIATVVVGVIRIIRGIVTVVAGVLRVIVGLFTGNNKMLLQGLGTMARGVGIIFKGIFTAIWGIVKAGWAVIRGVFAGIVGGIVGFFKWLYDVLGLEVVPKTVNKIIEVFKRLAGLAKWVYDNVVAPVVRFFRSMATKIVEVVRAIWGRVKDAFSGIKKIGGWIWDNALSPAIGKVNAFKNRVIEGFKTWWGGIKTALGFLKGLGKWIWDNSLGAVVQRFKDMFNRIGDWLSDHKSKITSPFKSIINFAIRGVNKMTGGLNKVADVLPGLSWNIKAIPELAAGGQIPGRKVGNGWITNGARAIVGEGKPNHPEYVVPTDPTHRNRAIGLWRSLGERLGALDGRARQTMDTNTQQRNVQGVPMYSLGGIIEAAAGGVKAAAKGVKKLARNAASLAYKPFGAAVDGLIDKVNWKYARDPMKSVHGKVRDWIKGADDFGNKVSKQIGGKWVKPLNGGYSIGGGLGSYKGHNGQDFPVPSGTKVRAITAGTVSSSRDISGPGGYRSYGRVVEVRHSDGYKSLYAHNRSRNVSTGQKVQPGDVLAHSGSTGNSSGPHLHLSIWKNGDLKSPLDVLRSKGVRMARGGIIRARTGGVGVLAGERGQDEAIIPLPREWKDGGFGGKREVNIYGNLEFPNVTNGEDAEDFLNNLESVSED